MGAGLRVTPTCTIDLDELTWRFARSGGPGGQHANTSDTRAEVRFDVAASPSLGPRQRARLLERLGPVVTAAAAGLALAGPQPRAGPRAPAQQARRRAEDGAAPSADAAGPSAPASGASGTNGTVRQRKRDRRRPEEDA